MGRFPSHKNVATQNAQQTLISGVHVNVAAVLRHLYMRAPAGVGSITRIFGGISFLLCFHHTSII